MEDYLQIFPAINTHLSLDYNIKFLENASHLFSRIQIRYTYSHKAWHNIFSQSATYFCSMCNDFDSH